MTHNGVKLKYGEKGHTSKKGTIPKFQRFKGADTLDKWLVGPGSYNPDENFRTL